MSKKIKSINVPQVSKRFPFKYLVLAAMQKREIIGSRKGMKIRLAIDGVNTPETGEDMIFK